MAQLPARKNQGGSLTPRGEHPLERLQRSFDTLFNSLWGGRLAPFEQDFEPVRLWDFDVKENDKEITVRAEMPGFEEKELDVQLSNDVLTIKAEKEQKGDGREEYRSFYRSITLPGGINSDNVQASYRNGVLELRIPRAEGAQPRRIQVQTEQAANRPQVQQTPSGQAGTAASEKAKK
jgi:HSP20 family protein